MVDGREEPEVAESVMAKLFVALELSTQAKAELIRIQPAARSGLRLPEASQLHVTLHYLGEVEVGRAVEALNAFSSRAFEIDLEGVGQFPSQDGAVTLWAGVKRGEGIMDLHRGIASALSVMDFRPEAREFRPHVTVGRFAPGIAGDGVDNFLEANARFSLASIPVASFALYSSRFVGNAPVYTREREFRLA